MRKHVQPTTIDGLLDTCLDRAVGMPGASAIWRVWPDAVGAAIARRAEPMRLRGRTLVVAVSSAPWMQELSLLKRGIVTAVNERLPRPLLDDLHLVLTEGRNETIPTRPRARTAPCPPPPTHADLGDLPASLQTSFGAVLEAWRRRARPH